MNYLKEKINEMIPSEEAVHQQKVLLKNKKHELEHLKVLLNKQIGINNGTKKNIGIVRRELKFAKLSNAKMEAKINDLNA